MIGGNEPGARKRHPRKRGPRDRNPQPGGSKRARTKSPATWAGKCRPLHRPVGSTTNGGIQPPTFLLGPVERQWPRCRAGATVRVFRKETPEAGEIESFLGEAVATPAATGKLLTPPRSRPGRSSPRRRRACGRHLRARDRDHGSRPEQRRRSGGKDDKAKQDKVSRAKAKRRRPAEVPESTITKGPKGKIHSTTAKFKFTASEKGAKFECKLDRKNFKPCKSPKTIKD